MLKKSFILALLIVFSLISWGCEESKPLPLKEDTIKEEVKPDQVVEEASPETIGSFKSRDGKLYFSYREDWICKEVIYGVRVDCYPRSRQEEQYDMGFDEMAVPYSNLTFLIDKCDAREIVDDGRIRSPQLVRKYGNCNSLVLIDDPNINSEADLDRIIWRTDSPGPAESDPGYVVDPLCAEFEDQVMLAIQGHHASSGVTAQLDNLFFSSQVNHCLYSWTAIEEYTHFYFIGDPTTNTPYLEAVHGCYEQNDECPLTYGEAFADFQERIKRYE